ncbi:hypothetical protein IEQ44_11605 [Nocardioides sp. Y6]|uniref:Uncharacterized protein n=1 Tax=Nocardioides malaquae TaxID=2773426 RepID=A0ABR9RUP3_9ACTN|nr:hypothetical protein [Nocardioides malaquae]MBE7325300.1 hypothetical protein [Nocardioides malaquae]
MSSQGGLRTYAFGDLPRRRPLPTRPSPGDVLPGPSRDGACRAAGRQGVST